MIKPIAGQDGVLKFVDIRGNWWCVRRTKWRHYQASRDGKHYTRCHLHSIATVFGCSTEAIRHLILGE